jgi:hypothetical protein
MLRAYLQGIPVLGVPTLRAVHYGEPATLTAFFRQQLWHANWRSYRKIVKKTGARVGGNAPLFTLAFGAALVSFLAGCVSAATRGPGWAALLIVPLPVVLLLPAAVIAWRAGKPAVCIPLAVLYSAYGTARLLDLLGLGRAKRSWKS